jgi:phytoene/squalene synthetase
VPKPQREAVALAYLLARFADTLTDSGKIPLEERLTHLKAWETAISLRKHNGWELTADFTGLSRSEAQLLLEGDLLLREFGLLSEDHQNAGREVLGILIEAMRWDLDVFGKSVGQVLYGVENNEDFDWYCYSIAGCVGAYWVKIFELSPHLIPAAIAYGKGLQRINILRDVVEDWQRGRVYLPLTDLKKFELDQGPIWEGKRWKEYRQAYCAETERLLQQGAQFCKALPYFSWRLKWASAMPLQIGFKTLELLKYSDDWSKPLKISRSEVKKLMLKTALETPLPF